MVLILMGVSGSGKTTLGRLLADSLGWAFFDADEFHPESNLEMMRRGTPLTDADRVPWLDSLRKLIESELEQAENAVLACSALKASYRRRLKQGDPEVRFIYLKGDYDLFHQRLEGRAGHFMRAELLASQFDALEEPQDVLAVDAADEPAKIVAAIIRLLGLEGEESEQ